MATKGKAKGRVLEIADLAAAIQEPKRDPEQLLAGLEDVRRAVAAWLGVELQRVNLKLNVFDDEVLARLAMPKDTDIRTARPTRQHYVRRQNGDLIFCVVECWDPDQEEGQGQ